MKICYDEIELTIHVIKGEVACMMLKEKNFLWSRVILYFLMGIFIFINPTFVLKWVVYMIAGALVLLGIIDIIAYFRMEQGTGFFHFDFVSGLILILLGCVLAMRHTEIINLIHIFVGIMIVLDGANSFMQSRHLARQKIGSVGVMTIYSLIVIAVGALIVFNPFAVQVATFRFIAAILIALAISDLVWYFRFRNA